MSIMWKFGPQTTAAQHIVGPERGRRVCNRDWWNRRLDAIAAPGQLLALDGCQTGRAVATI